MQATGHSLIMKVGGHSEELIDRVNHIGLVCGTVETICDAANNLEASFERYLTRLMIKI